MFQFGTIIMKHFDPSIHNWQSTANILIAVVYFLILLPFFGTIFQNIQLESMTEVMLSYGVRDQFKRMVDSLQEGIIVLNNGHIEFMNDLSNKFIKFLSGM